MTGRLEKTVIDCPDPRALAAFYAELLGMRVNEDSDDWVVIGRAPGARELAFQRARVFVPPRWPDPRHPQRLHLDIRVDDVDRAEQVVLALGGRRLPAERESGFRVFADPVGHPFCLVFGSSGQPLSRWFDTSLGEEAASGRPRSSAWPRIPREVGAEEAAACSFSG